MAISGDIKCLIQAKSGKILAGTNAGAGIYYSTNNGQTWVHEGNLGAGSDSVNALAIDRYSGIIVAAVTGSASAQGLWRSVDHGVHWTRVKTHPNGLGYLDVVTEQGGATFWAVGPAVASSTESPIVRGTNQGTTWTNVSTTLFNRDHIAVAASFDPVLPTLYPGQPSNTGTIRNFYGVDGFFTAAGGLGMGLGGLSGVSVLFNTVGGGAGDGGLDMASFIFKNAQGSFYQRALWAVRSHLNTADTEIWQWPASNTGPFQWAKIATLVGERFNVLYVDFIANWQSIGAERTIWAGADGKIFVSYNSGLTWALATDAPVGEVYAFVRTTAGTLIAGGKDGEIYRFGAGGSEGGGDPGPPPDPPPGEPPPPPPPPEDPSTATTRFLGRAATCEDEVYAANKFSFSNVTHVFYYNGAAYTNLQFGAEPPYNLLGTTPAVNRAVYFGSRTSDSNIPGGTFTSLVFDITQIANNITVVWEYWNGDAWATLTVQDRAAGFAVPGPNSVHWQVPADWATTAVNSVSGYWVRARVSAVGSNPVGPVHGNRYIYTVNLPYVEIADEEIGGEIPALAQVLWSNRGDNPGGSPGMAVHRLLVGLRSVARGNNYNAYINVSDRQVPFGVSVTALRGNFEDALMAPTARRYTVAYSNGGDLNTWQDLVRVSLATTVARDYYGDFRVFLRGLVTPGDADDWRFRLALGFGSGGMVSYSREQFGRPAQVDFRLYDMGSLRIPHSTAGVLISDEMSITVQGYATATNVAAKLYDLILLPLDEWAGDFVHTNLTNASIPSGIEGSNYLDIDSITNPKIPLGAYNRLESGLVKALYQPITNGEAILQVGQRQRLWFLAAQYAFASASWGAHPAIAGRVRVNKVQQYLGPRGAG